MNNMMMITFFKMILGFGIWVSDVGIGIFDLSIFADFASVYVEHAHSGQHITTIMATRSPSLFTSSNHHSSPRLAT